MLRVSALYIPIGTGCLRVEHSRAYNLLPVVGPTLRLAKTARHPRTVESGPRLRSESLLYMLITLACAGHVPMLPVYTTLVTPLSLKIPQSPQSRPSSLALDRLQQLSYLLPFTRV